MDVLLRADSVVMLHVLYGCVLYDRRNNCYSGQRPFSKLGETYTHGPYGGYNSMDPCYQVVGPGLLNASQEIPTLLV